MKQRAQNDIDQLFNWCYDEPLKGEPDTLRHLNYKAGN